MTRIWRISVEVPEHVDIDGLLDEVAHTAYCWEARVHPDRDWDIACGATVIEVEEP